MSGEFDAFFFASFIAVIGAVWIALRGDDQ